MGTSRRRLAACISSALAGIGLVALPASSATPTITRHVFEIVRTTQGPATMQLNVAIYPSQQEPSGFEGSFTGRVDAKGHVKEVVSLGARLFGRYEDPSIGVQGQEHQVCPVAGACAVERSLAYSDVLYLKDSGGADAYNRFWVVTEGPATIKLLGNGWKIRPASHPYRYVASAQSSQAGVYAGTDSVEAFSDTALSGGAHGSLGVLVPPCARDGAAPEPAPRGFGTVTLQGGRTSPQFTCPSSVTTPFPTSFATSKTLWRGSGQTVGDSSFAQVRLFVLDL